MGKLAEKIVLITGGTTGIGRETARLFRDEGATVFITGLDSGNLDRARSSLGPGIEAVLSDVTRIQDIDAVMKRIETGFGRLDVLFANAGTGSHRSIESVDEVYFDHIFDLNVRGLYFTVQRALPLMPEGAAIVLTASVAAHIGAISNTVYAASKAAVRSLGRSFAAELLPRGIRVNTLTPGPIRTPLMAKSGLPVDTLAEMLRQNVPMKRLGEPLEAAHAALFLACEDSSFMTGAEVVVSGGLSDL